MALPMRSVLSVAGLVLGVGTLRAQGAPPPSIPSAPDRGAPELPSVTPPPALERILRDYERAWRAGDAAGLAALFAPDGFVLPGGAAPVRGRAAIQRAYTGQAGGPLRLRVLAYATADTVGYLLGAFAYGDAPRDAGKFTLTLRRAADGSWRIFSDMDNPNAYPRRPAPP